MKTKYLLVSLLLAFCGSISAQINIKLAALLIPEELTENADEVIRYENKEFYVKSDREGVLSHKQIVTIFSSKSDANELVVYYDKQTKVTKIRAKIYDSLGNLIRKIEKDEVKDIAAVDGFSLALDDRFKYLEVTHNSYPYTIEFEYERVLKGGYYHAYPDWYIQHYNRSVQESSFTINLPDDFEFYYKALNVDIEPKIGESGGRKLYNWTVKDLPAIKYEPYGPVQSAILPRILFSPHQFYFAGYRGSMASWKEYGQFMNALYEGRDELPKELLLEIKELTSTAQTNREKIDILYQYMQENMRYVSVQLGIGGWQPFDANYVSKNKYGDCKALTNFMKAMLKAVDIKAYPVLIKNGRIRYEITEDYATPQFNHVILHIPSEDYWLECTSQNYPANYIGSGNMNRKVLLVDEEGGKVIQTPRMSAADNMEQNKVSIVLKEDGSATLRNSILAKGERHELYRAMEKQLSQQEQQEYLKEHSSLPSFDINKLIIKASSKQPEATVEYDLAVSRYASKAGKRLFVPVNAISPFKSVPPEMEERQFPVVHRRNFTEVDTIELQIPKGYEVESIPNSSYQKEVEYATYELQIEKTETGIRCVRKLQMKKAELSSDSYPDFRNVLKEISKKDKMKIVLVQKKT